MSTYILFAATGPAKGPSSYFQNTLSISPARKSRSLSTSLFLQSKNPCPLGLREGFVNNSWPLSPVAALYFFCAPLALHIGEEVWYLCSALQTFFEELSAGRPVYRKRWILRLRLRMTEKNMGWQAKGRAILKKMVCKARTKLTKIINNKVGAHRNNI